MSARPPLVRRLFFLWCHLDVQERKRSVRFAAGKLPGPPHSQRRERPSPHKRHDVLRPIRARFDQRHLAGRLSRNVIGVRGSCTESMQFRSLPVWTSRLLTCPGRRPKPHLDIAALPPLGRPALPALPGWRRGGLSLSRDGAEPPPSLALQRVRADLHTLQRHCFRWTPPASAAGRAAFARGGAGHLHGAACARAGAEPNDRARDPAKAASQRCLAPASDASAR